MGLLPAAVAATMPASTAPSAGVAGAWWCMGAMQVPSAVAVIAAAASAAPCRAYGCLMGLPAVAVPAPACGGKVSRCTAGTGATRDALEGLSGVMVCLVFSLALSCPRLL